MPSSKANDFMPDHRFLAQLLATDPRREVRFPDLPVESALAEWQMIQATPPVVENRASTPPIPLAENGASQGQSDPLEAVGLSLGSLATHVWRAKKKMIEAETGEPREEMKRVYRHVEGVFDVFAQMGIVLNDWLDQPYDAGLPVKVLSFQPTPGLSRDMILEVVRPTVIWKDRLLQLGEVIVGIPVNSENPFK
jgi:hypothetical protein